MFYAALRLGLVLVAILVVEVYSSCLFPKTCPCGASGKNYTRCYNTKIEQYSCERWANCQTCEDNYEFCVTCPPGRSGPTCKDVLSCPLLKRPKNGQIMCSHDSNSYKSCTARCLPGFRFENHRMDEEITLNCEQNVWVPRQNIPDCKSIETECTLRGSFSYQPGQHSFNCTTAMHGKSCDITCNSKPQGRYHCYPGKGWNSTLPSCVSSNKQPSFQWKKEKVICPDPGTPKDGGRMDMKGNSIPSQHTFMEGDAVLYFCKGRNATFQGNTFLTCKPDGTWAGIPPLCVTAEEVSEVKVLSEASCKHPGVVENGIIEDFESDTEQFPVGTELKFLCREGYEINGPEAIYCLLNLSWSEAPPVCNSPTTTASPPSSQMPCKHPGTVENGFIADDVPGVQSFPLGSELRFKCNEGHEMLGAEVIYCLRSVDQRGYWSDVPPFCRYVVTTTPQNIPEIYCKYPGGVKNAIIVNYLPGTERFLAGTALVFQCREGYELVGKANLYCKRNGEWSQGPPNCRFIPNVAVQILSCAHPGMVENGRFEGDTSKSSFPVGAALKIYCNTGFQIEGPMVILCRQTGKWSRAPPTCKSIAQQRIQEPEKTSPLPCKHPGIIQNGIIEYSASEGQDYLVGSEIKFKCKEGYTIEGSDTLRCGDTGEWTSPLPTCRPTKRIPECGRVFQDIYNLTREYTRSDWPWTVGISTVGEDDAEKMFCGGALLNSKTVLTAAHCATSSRHINLHFGYRRQSATGALLPEQSRTIQISRVIMHPEYDDETHANDIALMKFEPHVYYDRRTQTVCLPTPTLDSSGENLFPGTKAIVTGYGLHFAANYSSSAMFMMLEFPVQNARQCEEVCRNQGLLSCSPSTFCAGHWKNANECVYGGSPLVVFHPEKNRYTLEGLATRAESARNRWNGRCKRPESFTIFTNVTNFMPFILEHLH